MRIFYKSFSTLIKRNAKGLFDIGLCHSLNIKCLSELGWKDNALFDAESKNQPNILHWNKKRDQNNLLGVSSLIEVVHESPKKSMTFLSDAGWRHAYMNQMYQMHGIDKILSQKIIKFLLITHEHHDHFLGAPCVIKHFPSIPLYFPSTFTWRAFDYLNQVPFESAAEPNLQAKHVGPKHLVYENQMIQLGNCEGIASSMFDVELGEGLRGEISIFVNIARKGLVIITGCGHPGILRLINFAQKNIVGGDKIYGLYGGLHLSPFGYLFPYAEEAIKELVTYSIPKVAANHCTGEIGIETMIQAGISIVAGSKGNRISDGDIVRF